MDTRLIHLENQIDRIAIDYHPAVRPDQQPVELIVDQLWVHYRQDQPERPLWLLIEDMQQQVMVYTNIIEQLKWGIEAPTIKAQLQNLDLVPDNTLPNPNGSALLKRALGKIARYRVALVDIVNRYGRSLVFDDLNFARELTPSVEVQIGFSPAVSIGVEFSGGRD